MADGKFILKSNGNFGLRSGGVFDTCGDCCCPATISVVISGVDAAKCACGIVGGTSWLISTLAVDGTYDVDFLNEGTSGGREICTYRSCFDFGATVIMQQDRFAGTVCAGVPTHTVTRTKFTINFSIYKDNGKVARVAVMAVLDCVDGFGFLLFNLATVAYPGADRGAALANDLTCSLNATASNGGTFTAT